MNATNYYDIIIAIFGCLGFWELVRYLIESRRKKKSALEQATLALLHETIYPLLEEAVLRGNVGIEEFDRIDNLYQPYTRLGGNGTVRRRYELVVNLPRTDDRKEGYNEQAK